MRVAVLGADGEERAAIVEALDDAGAAVEATEGVGEAALRDAEVPDSDAVVVLGGERATLIPVARGLADGLRIVLVADDAPDFVRGTVDLILTGDLASAENVVDAVTGAEGDGDGEGDDGATGGGDDGGSTAGDDGPAP